MKSTFITWWHCIRLRWVARWWQLMSPLQKSCPNPAVRKNSPITHSMSHIHRGGHQDNRLSSFIIETATSSTRYIPKCWVQQVTRELRPVVFGVTCMLLLLLSFTCFYYPLWYFPSSAPPFQGWILQWQMHQAGMSSPATCRRSQAKAQPAFLLKLLTHDYVFFCINYFLFFPLILRTWSSSSTPRRRCGLSCPRFSAGSSPPSPTGAWTRSSSTCSLTSCSVKPPKTNRNIPMWDLWH